MSEIAFQILAGIAVVIALVWAAAFMVAFVSFVLDAVIPRNPKADP